MNNIYALNKEFKEQQELSHDELNLIVTKINEIIAFIAPLNKDSETDPQDDNQNEGITKSIEELIQEAISGLVADVDRLKNTPSGQVVTEEMWAQYRNKTDQAMQKASAIEMAFDGIDLTSLAANIQAAETLVSQLSISPEKINLIVSLIDDDNHLIIDPAQIIAAITKDDESGELISSIKISADQVKLSAGGNVTVDAKLTDIQGQLNAIYAEFQNVGVKDTLTSVHIKGGDINIGNGTFVVDANGHVTANNITLDGQGSTFIVSPDGPDTVTLPDARMGASAVVINLWPSTQEYSNNRRIEVKTKSYDNFNYSDHSKNSYIKVKEGNHWSISDGVGTSLPNSCSLKGQGYATFSIASAIFASDGKDWYLVFANLV